MKNLLLLMSVLMSAEVIANPVCTYTTNSKVKIKLMKKAKDSFSSAYTYFKHEMVEGKENEMTKEFSIKLSEHIDHYRTKFKVFVNGDEYIYEQYLAQSLFDRNRVVYNSKLKLKGEFYDVYINRTTGEKTYEKVKRNNMTVGASSRTSLEYYNQEGASGSVDTFLRKAEGKDDDIEIKRINIDFKCTGNL